MRVVSFLPKALSENDVKGNLLLIFVDFPVFKKIGFLSFFIICFDFRVSYFKETLMYSFQQNGHQRLYVLFLHFTFFMNLIITNFPI